MNNFIKPLNDLSKETQEYIDLRVEDVKLRSVKALSTGISEIISSVLVLLLFSVVLILVAAGLSVILGEYLNNLSLGIFAVAGIYTLIALIVLCLRKRLFRNALIKTFIRIFFK